MVNGLLEQLMEKHSDLVKRYGSVQSESLHHNLLFPLVV